MMQILETNISPPTAVITPSYGGDFERCEMLVESLGHCAPSLHHYVIVDSHDLTRFRHLASARTSIMDSREILDPWLHKMPGRSGYWWSLRTPPVRGWMVQQLLKLGANRVCPEEVLVCCDSDTLFVRPFGYERLLVNGKLGLLDVDYRDDDVVKWTRSARSLLGLAPESNLYRGHVGVVIVWHRSVLEQMQQRIQAVKGLPWQQPISRLRTFSEYVTYGAFVREVIGYEASPHAPSTSRLVKASWGNKLETETEISAFFSSLEPENIAVMVHSKDGVDPSSYRRNVEALWQSAAF
jgi:hypothetical protein